MSSVGTYWRTLRHLRWEQWVGRLRHKLARPQVRPGPAPALRAATGQWVRGAGRLPSLEGPLRFRFLNESHELSPGRWDDPALARLWRYNLHYFDDLNAIDAATRRPWQHALVDRWIAENPAPSGSGWEPYPTSLRIVNWVKWSLAGETLTQAQLGSLAMQTRWLRDRLETHLLGNHLFANAKALLFAGLFFDSPEARGWIDCALGLLRREVPEQFLDDGGHFERSPMYHALALEDLLDLVDVIDTLGRGIPEANALARDLRARIPALQRWLQAMTHPDGTLGMFNDCAMDIAPSQAELDSFATRLGLAPPAPPGEGAVVLGPTGYVRLALGPAVALLDVARIGPDYLPGHAHADTLSFELSVQGQRVVVNGGTSLYAEGERRQFERSTAAHSTVQVDGHDSSEVWAGFRVGRRARPVDLDLSTGAPPWTVRCAHDGYRHLKGTPQPVRTWTMSADGLRVEDRVSAASTAVARYLLAPGIEFTPVRDGRWQFARGGVTLGTVDVEAGRARVERASASVRFGPPDETTCLLVALDNGSAATHWRWN